MASINLQGDTSGEITISAPAVAGTNTLTLPASTGTVITSNSPASDLPSTIAGPAFSAYLGSTQAISASTNTKVNYDTESFDTNSNYDTTNKRFTPTVAGYYQVNAWVNGNASGFLEVYIYKNGSLAQKLSYSYPASVQANGGSALINLNGTTDYIEIYMFTTGTPTLLSGSTNGYFQAFLARAA